MRMIEPKNKTGPLSLRWIASCLAMKSPPYLHAIVAKKVLATMFAALGLIFVVGNKLYNGKSILPHSTHGVLGLLVSLRLENRFRFHALVCTRSTT